MKFDPRIKHAFEESLRIKKLAQDRLLPSITAAGDMLLDCLQNKHKILCCGNGGSASDAQHFAAELVNRFLLERDPLACIALNADTAVMTAIANDYSYEEVFAKQVFALGSKGDILLAISTSGNSRNVIKAVETAKQRKLRVIALTGGDGGGLSALLKKDTDLEVRVPGDLAPRVQETHILILHCWCDFIESAFQRRAD